MKYYVRLAGLVVAALLLLGAADRADAADD
jgi:hypothetical protein